jgi:hypothetical protein
MEELSLKRVYLETETLGSIYDIDGELICKTMELPWRNNNRNVSCIPEGTYKVILQPPKESRPYPYFRVLDVPNRSGILLHRITYVEDLRGCIGVGSRFHDFNGDGVPDMAQSSVKLTWMTENLPEEFLLTISEKR